MSYETMLMKAQAGMQTVNDGQWAAVRGGRAGEIIVQQLHGRYYEIARRGQVFIASTAAAGLALPIFSATAQLFMLWNPNDSGFNLELISVKLGRVSGTDTDGHLCWGYKTGMGSALGTPCSAFTAGTPVNALLGGSSDSITFFAPATATVTAPSYLCPMGFSTAEMADAQNLQTATLKISYEDDPLIVAPGTAIFAAKNLTSGTVWALSLTYARVPV